MSNADTTAAGPLRPTDDDRGLFWQLEATHFPVPLTRWTATLYVTEETRVIAELAERYGLLIDGVAMKEFGGRVYTTVVPLGGRARKPPPAFLVPLLSRVVPILRRRMKAARQAEATDAWRGVLDAWLAGGEDAMLAEGRALLATPLEDRDDAGLAAAVGEAVDLAKRGVAQHFLLHGVGVHEIGRLGVALERVGFSAADFSELFTGLSGATVGPAAAQRAIVDLVRAAGGLEALRTAEQLDDVRAIAPEVDAAITRYLDDWAVRAVRYEVAEATVIERPEWVLQALRALTDRDPDPGLAEAQRRTRAKAAVRAAAALGGGADAAARIERAQRAFPVREGNEAATIGIPLAALRHVGLAVGRRLATAGRLERPEDVFDLEIDEVVALLEHGAAAPPDPAARALARRTVREREAAMVPPASLGTPDAGPPSFRGLPADVVELLDATLWYTAKVTGTAASGDEQVAGDTTVATGPRRRVTGLGVAPGLYEGPVRVVLDESAFDRIEPGDVLVCPITSPVWSMVFPALGALVCDTGGALSHPAIIAREFGIPAVVATGDATTVLAEGSRVRVDGDAGSVEVL